MNVVPRRAVCVLVVLGAISWIGHAFLPKKNILRPARSTVVRKEGPTETDSRSPKDMFFAATDKKPSFASQAAKEQRRALGSQELLMLPRQYGPNADVRFPQMNHVSCTVLSATPSEEIMRKAIDEAIQAHPLLHCRIVGVALLHVISTTEAGATRKRVLSGKSNGIECKEAEMALVR
jgi:hypothetical protein